VTTNIDAERAVVWNMGAIASSDSPGALDLFRKVMIASTSIPGAVSPDDSHHVALDEVEGDVPQRPEILAFVTGFARPGDATEEAADALRERVAQGVLALLVR